ncbi:MAG: HEAT repeat domain-containing protein [Phycisphaerae bacterium]|nr:HEAT repeat domain-containing protein [Phycisphaerae bacterium]
MRLSSVATLCVFVLISASCAAQVQEPDTESVVAATTGDDTQLEMNKIALLTGSTEQMRLMAANIMLQSKDPRARELVLEALQNRENTEARAAICKVLSQSKTSSGIEISSKEQFIEPLLGMIKETEQPVLPLATEALLIYDYNTVGLPLESLARDASQDVQVRLNAMYGLKLRLDKRAPIAILKLGDDPEPRVSEAANGILPSMPIPQVSSPADRDRIIDELERMSKDEFLKNWVFRQDKQLRAERAQVEMWKRLFKDVLDKHYDQADTTVRETLLLEHLKAPQSFRKLWAIDKVYKWRTQANTELPDSLTPVLKSLISDSDKMVRLNAATQLFNIVKIDSADVLIQQLNIEKEADVRTKLFAALGEACRTALVAEGVPDEIKAKTLELAAKFLADPSADQAVKGADVISRLLEKNGLAETDIDTYLGLLKERFEREMAGDIVIKRNLLRTMALLCANPSGCKRQARLLYKPIFDKCLEDESPLVREEAFQGLVSIDNVQALKVLRAKLVNDSSANVRIRVIALAKDVGTAEDLDWLMAKIEAGTEADVAWQTILTILSRSEVKTLETLYGRFTALRTQGKLANSQWQGFLEVARAKATGNKELLVKVYQDFADFCVETGVLERAREHYMSLAELVDAEGKANIRSRLLGLDLKGGRVKEVSALLSSELKVRDLDESDSLIQAINTFLSEAPEGQDPRATVHAVLKAIQVSESRPEWEKIKALWLSVEATAADTVTDTNSPS